MEITEIRVKMVNNTADRLKAYCSVTVDDCFVVRDLKVIDGSNGLFVAMPSRKLAARCTGCSTKNHLRARFCNECGKKLTESNAFKGSARTKLHADVAHPINAECREFIQERVLEEFAAEESRSQQPDYSGSDYDEDFTEQVSPYAELIQELKGQGDAIEEDLEEEVRDDSTDEDEQMMDQEEPTASSDPDEATAVGASDDRQPSATSGEQSLDDDDSFGAGL